MLTEPIIYVTLFFTMLGGVGVGGVGVGSGKEEAPLCRKRGGDGSVGERLAQGQELG